MSLRVTSPQVPLSSSVTSSPPATAPSPKTAPVPRAPALSPAITRRLGDVIPANMQLDARWENLRLARETSKTRAPGITPSLMIAWCVTRAMALHPAARRVIAHDGTIAEQTVFDLGVAVALEGDRLATAVVKHASQLDWPAFAAAYQQAVADTRAGKITEVQAPLNLTSLGAFGVEIATPIVVPPAMGTLFVGTTHTRMMSAGGVVFPTDVVTLSLTFDHRVVNGSGAAVFLHTVRKQIEEFQLPG